MQSRDLRSFAAVRAKFHGGPRRSERASAISALKLALIGFAIDAGSALGVALRSAVKQTARAP
jgi:hypothetical protein